MYNVRRSAGGRKLWEAKDEKPWLHDRFEELKLREDNYYGQVFLLLCNASIILLSDGIYDFRWLFQNLMVINTYLVA